MCRAGLVADSANYRILSFARERLASRAAWKPASRILMCNPSSITKDIGERLTEVRASPIEIADSEWMFLRELQEIRGLEVYYRGGVTPIAELISRSEGLPAQLQWVLWILHAEGVCSFDVIRLRTLPEDAICVPRLPCVHLVFGVEVIEGIFGKSKVDEAFANSTRPLQAMDSLTIESIIERSAQRNPSQRALFSHFHPDTKWGLLQIGDDDTLHRCPEHQDRIYAFPWPFGESQYRRAPVRLFPTVVDDAHYAEIEANHMSRGGELTILPQKAPYIHLTRYEDFAAESRKCSRKLELGGLALHLSKRIWDAVFADSFPGTPPFPQDEIQRNTSDCSVAREWFTTLQTQLSTIRATLQDDYWNHFQHYQDIVNGTIPTKEDPTVPLAKSFWALMFKSHQFSNIQP